jgi:predicted DNA repair protein MutK
VNAEKASGYHASREIPVIMSILKGSLVNKVVILIFILPLSIYFPSLIGPVLIL